MVKTLVSPKKGIGVDIPMSMPGNEALVSVEALGTASVWNKPGHRNRPPMPRVIHSLAIKLRVQEAMKAEFIHIEPPRKKIKQGLPRLCLGLRIIK